MLPAYAGYGIALSAIFSSAVIVGVGHERVMNEMRRFGYDVPGGSRHGSFESLSVSGRIRMRHDAFVEGDLTFSSGDARLSAAEVSTNRLEVTGTISTPNVSIDGTSVTLNSRGTVSSVSVNGPFIRFSSAPSSSDHDSSKGWTRELRIPDGITASGGASFSPPVCRTSTCGTPVKHWHSMPPGSLRDDIESEGGKIRPALVVEGPLVMDEDASIFLGSGDIVFRHKGRVETFRNLVSTFSSDSARFSASYMRWNTSVKDINALVNNTEAVATSALNAVQEQAHHSIANLGEEVARWNAAKLAYDSAVVKANQTLSLHMAKIDAAVQHVEELLGIQGSRTQQEMDHNEEKWAAGIASYIRDVKAYTDQIKQFIDVGTGNLSVNHLHVSGDLVVGNKSVASALRYVEEIVSSLGGMRRVRLAASQFERLNRTLTHAAERMEQDSIQIREYASTLEAAAGTLPEFISQLQDRIEEVRAANNKLDYLINRWELSDEDELKLLGPSEAFVRSFANFQREARDRLENPRLGIIRSDVVEAKDVILSGEVSILRDVVPAAEKLLECESRLERISDIASSAISQEKRLSRRLEELKSKVSRIEKGVCPDSGDDQDGDSVGRRLLSRHAGAHNHTSKGEHSRKPGGSGKGARTLLSTQAPSTESIIRDRYCGSYFARSRREMDDDFRICRQGQQANCDYRRASEVTYIYGWKLPELARITMCLPHPSKMKIRERCPAPVGLRDDGPIHIDYYK